MKYLILPYYFVVLINWSANGQSGFNNSYLIDSQQTTFLQALLIDDTIYTLGRHIDRETGLLGIGISQFDTLGNMIKHKTFVDTIENRPIVPTRYRPMLYTSAEKFVIAGVRVPNNQLFMMQLDKDLELEFLNFYPENHGSYRIGRILEKGKSFYICGQVQRFTYDDDVILIKFDSVGNLLWEKTYGFRYKNDVISGGVWSSDSTIQFFAGSSTFPHPDDEDDYEGQNWIFEVDTSGQILWEWRSEINPDHGGIRTFKKLDDGGWIMVTYPRHPDELNYVHTSGGLILTDASFNTIWFQEWGLPFTYYTAFNDLILTKDSSALVVGNVAEKIPVGIDTSSVLKGWVVKVDLNGNTVWEVRDTAYWDYGGNLPTSISWLTSCVELASGNVIAVGHSERRIFTPDLFEGWMIKITPDGCVDTLCNMTTAIEEAHHSEKILDLYPNPAADHVYVSFSPEHLSNTRILLLDMHGKIVYHTGRVNAPGTMIPVGDLPSGMYVLQLISRGEMVQVEKVVVQ